ncbi:MAG: hypothetical protein K6G00_07480, partial [Treponema sp.]|nr:hypothetical protein [Treponema sp.]
MLKKTVFRFALLLSSLFILNSAFVVSAASKRQRKSSSRKSSAGIVIPVPESAKKSQSYFSSVPPRIMALVEDGSPRSLKMAASLLHKNSEDLYTEKEKILLSLCQTVMQVAWPSQTVSWSVPEFSRSDAYTNAAYSASHGMFDSKIKNEDFLSLVLPSLSILAGNSAIEYYKKIESNLIKALELKNSSTLANYLMGILKYKDKDYKNALAYFSKALESDDSNKEILLYGVKVCNLSKDYRTSLSFGERILSQNPQDIETLKLVCDAYYADGDMSNAGAYAAKVLMLAPDSFEYVLMRAKIAMSEGDFVKTSSLLDAYSRSGSVSKDYYLLRARLQREWNKNNNSAAETIGKALLSYPEDADINLYAAMIASDANILIAGKSALDFASLVLKKNSSDRNAVRICVTELNEAGNYEKAYELSNMIIRKSSATVDDFCTHIDIC